MVVAINRLLVLNPQAGSLSDDALERLRSALADFDVLELQEGDDLGELLTRRELAADAVVAVAGGDGTVSAAARALAHTGRRLAIIPLGTYNNFARALSLPEDPEAAARVATDGRDAPVKLGRVNGRPFLEVAACGLFGDLINLGEAAKELRYGQLLERARALRAGSFEYSITGDVRRRGRARALVIANTPSTGALVPVADVTPEAADLQLTVYEGGLRADVLRAFVARLVPFLDRPRPGLRLRRVRIETDPPISVYADADHVGETPAEVEVDAAGLRMLLPEAGS